MFAHQKKPGVTRVVWRSRRTWHYSHRMRRTSVTLAVSSVLSSVRPNTEDRSAVRGDQRTRITRMSCLRTLPETRLCFKQTLMYLHQKQPYVSRANWTPKSITSDDFIYFFTYRNYPVHRNNQPLLRASTVIHKVEFQLSHSRQNSGIENQQNLFLSPV